MITVKICIILIKHNLEIIDWFLQRFWEIFSSCIFGSEVDLLGKKTFFL